jgi:methionine synthase I (cobalamin-dependent)
MREQARALADGGVDGILLEVGLDEVLLGLAVGAARTTGLPCVGEGAIPPGLSAAGAASILAGRPEADLVGIHCTFPERIQGVLRRLPGRLRAAYPCASVPGGRRLGPKAFARGAKRLAEAGVRLLGGCCGAGPDHIRAMAEEGIGT